MLYILRVIHSKFLVKIGVSSNIVDRIGTHHRNFVDGIDIIRVYYVLDDKKAEDWIKDHLKDYLYKGYEIFEINQDKLNTLLESCDKKYNRLTIEEKHLRKYSGGVPTEQLVDAPIETIVSYNEITPVSAQVTLLKINESIVRITDRLVVTQQRQEENQCKLQSLTLQKEMELIRFRSECIIKSQVDIASAKLAKSTNELREMQRRHDTLRMNYEDDLNRYKDIQQQSVSTDMIASHMHTVSEAIRCNHDLLQSDELLLRDQITCQQRCLEIISTLQSTN